MFLSLLTLTCNQGSVRRSILFHDGVSTPSGCGFNPQLYECKFVTIMINQAIMHIIVWTSCLQVWEGGAQGL
jgi:hypothetical protein